MQTNGQLCFQMTVTKDEGIQFRVYEIARQDISF